MAVKQVRAYFNGQWVNLTWNDATRRYEAVLTPTATSHHQTGGAYSIPVEVVNDSGASTTVDGGSIPGLNLTVNETTAPTLVFEAPAEGYVTENRPRIVLTATDEAGGSGVDPESLTLTLDGGSAWAGTLTRETVENGFRFQFLPAETMTEGPHVLRASVRDNDGNLTVTELRITVDTVPPELTLRPMRTVVDDTSILLTGRTGDVTGPPVTVSIANNGETAGTAEVDGDVFRFVLPLTVGENLITLTATDGAGLTTRLTEYAIRLITDRTAADVAALNALLAKPMSQWTAAEKAALLSGGMKGGYFASDLNRVGAAVDYLAERLRTLGYAVVVSAKQDWSNSDGQTDEDMEVYLANVAALRAVLAVFSTTPEPPEDLVRLTWREANDIERILVDVSRLITNLEKSWYCSGEVCAGEI